MAPNSLALTTTGLNNKGNPNKVTARSVPAFLNKLYSMVNDSATDELIRWSDDGDSFFVPSADRFGREILPRFFKHSNFGSFVRQLNMYGFHKVPHLQQGVLKNDEDSPELLEFTNPNFHRSQPDLLCLIRRQKARPDGSHPLPSSSSGNLALDLPTLITDLTSIRKHQTALSADLKDLQESNHALWQEALQSRERHKSQQDTINKILRFLATVFGGQVDGMGGVNMQGMAGMAMGMGMGNDAGERVVVEEDDDGESNGGGGGGGKGKGKEKAADGGSARRTPGGSRSRLLLEDVKGRKAKRDQQRIREDDSLDRELESEGARLEEVSTSGESEGTPREGDEMDELPTISSSSTMPPHLAKTNSNGFSLGSPTPTSATGAYSHSPSPAPMQGGSNGNGMTDQYGISQDMLDSLLSPNNENALNAFMHFRDGSTTENPFHPAATGPSSFNSPRPAILPSPPPASPSSATTITPLQTTLAQSLLSSAPALSIAPSTLNLPTIVTKDPQDEYYTQALRDSNQILSEVQNEKMDLDARTGAMEEAIKKLMDALPEETREQLNSGSGNLGGAGGEGGAGALPGGLGDDGMPGMGMSDADLEKYLTLYANSASPGISHQSPVDYSSMFDSSNNPISIRPGNAQSDWGSEDEFDDEDEEDGSDAEWTGAAGTVPATNSRKRPSDANGYGSGNGVEEVGSVESEEGVRRSARRRKL